MSNVKVKLTEDEANRLVALLTAQPSGPAGLHLTDDEFAAYPAGLMPAADAARIEHHLASCEECAKAVEFLFEEEAQWSQEEPEYRLAAKTPTVKKLHFGDREILCVAQKENGKVTVRFASNHLDLENVVVRVRLGKYEQNVTFQRIGNEVGAELEIPLEKGNDPGIEGIDLIEPRK